MLFASRAQLQNIWLLSAVNSPACPLSPIETLFNVFVCKCSILQIVAFTGWCFLTECSEQMGHIYNKYMCIADVVYRKKRKALCEHMPHPLHTHSTGSFCHLYHLDQLWWWASRLAGFLLDGLQGCGWWCCSRTHEALTPLPPQLLEVFRLASEFSYSRSKVLWRNHYVHNCSFISKENCKCTVVFVPYGIKSACGFTLVAQNKTKLEAMFNKPALPGYNFQCLSSQWYI